MVVAMNRRVFSFIQSQGISPLTPGRYPARVINDKWRA